MNNNKLSLSGMSSADDLIEVWNKFKSVDEPNLKVYWNFQNPDDSIKDSVYIMNLRSLYNPNVPGHWVALIRVGFIIYYYDPFGTILTKRGTKKIKCKYIYENIIKEQNFIGRDSDSCGYYCILFLLSFIRRFKQYNYVIFNNEIKKFVDTIPNNKFIRIDINHQIKEIENNILSEKVKK